SSTTQGGAVNLDVHQAAAEAKCHPDTLRKMAKAGEVPACKIGRAWVFAEELFQQWINARCLSTNVRPAESGGSGLAARLASQRARRIASKQQNSSSRSATDSGDIASSETVVRFPGHRQPSDG